MKYNAIVIGVSFGGTKAIPAVLKPLSENFPMSIIIVQHLSPDKRDNFYIEQLNERCRIKVKEADDKEPIKEGCVYLAPPAYHLLVERDKTLSLSVDDRVNYSRPSIDVLFETAAEAYSSGLIGIIMTGANADGAKGLKMIKEYNGLAIVQDPKTAEADAMPLAAIQVCEVDHILPLNKIGKFLENLAVENSVKKAGKKTRKTG